MRRYRRLSSWLHWRQGQRHLCGAGRAHDPTIAGAAPELGDRHHVQSVEKMGDAAAIADALQRLNGHERELLHLLHVRGVGLDRASTLLELPKGDVAELAHQAMWALHQAVEARR